MKTGEQMVRPNLKYSLGFLAGLSIISLLLYLGYPYYNQSARLKRAWNEYCQSVLDGKKYKGSDLYIQGIYFPPGMITEMRHNYEIKVVKGDDFEEMEYVSHTVYVATNSYEKGIRMEFDDDHDVYHIVGTWTKRSPSP